AAGLALLVIGLVFVLELEHDASVLALDQSATSPPRARASGERLREAPPPVRVAHHALEDFRAAMFIRAAGFVLEIGAALSIEVAWQPAARAAPGRTQRAQSGPAAPFLVSLAGEEEVVPD